MNRASVTSEDPPRIDRPEASARSRRRSVVTLVVLCLLLAGGNCQRWVPTNTDAGIGDVAAGSFPALTVVQTVALVPLVPGDSPQTLRGTFTNAGGVPVHVTSVTASLNTVTGNHGPCTTADYLLRDPVMPIDRDVAVGEGLDGWSGATIQMVDDPDASQDGCKLATLKITYRVT